jgi:hypothetical protein
MVAKKTETKSEGAAAAKPKATGSQHTYQVCDPDVGAVQLFNVSNDEQDMITDAIIAVFHPVPLIPAHQVSAPRSHPA